VTWITLLPLSLTQRSSHFRPNGSLACARVPANSRVTRGWDAQQGWQRFRNHVDRARRHSDGWRNLVRADEI